MLNRLHLTERQWHCLAKWSVYSALFLVTMLFQTVCLGNVRFFGVTLNFLPILVCCVCLRETPGSGGVYALCTATVWCLSGADYGSLSIVLWTGLGVGLAILCQVMINNRILTCALCCFAISLINETVFFFGKYLISNVRGIYYLTKALPCAVLSMVMFPVLYWLVKKVSRIGGSYGS